MTAKELIKDLREYMTITEIAAVLGIVRQTVYQWAGGQHQPMPHHMRLLRELHVEAVPSPKKSNP